MTTTELIKVLTDLEKGASGRSREISLYVYTSENEIFIPSSEIRVVSTGDGCAGAEICLEIIPNE